MKRLFAMIIKFIKGGTLVGRGGRDDPITVDEYIDEQLRYVETIMDGIEDQIREP